MSETVSLTFRAAGDGPPLVLLHAFPLTAEQWEANTGRLKSHALVVAPHLRGFGTSPVAASATMEEMADDVVRLCDRLGIGRAVFGGCSMGGYVAFAIRRRHPGRVRGLILADTRVVADTAEQRAGRATFAATVLEQGAEAAADALMPRLLRKTAGEAERKLVRGMILKNRPAGIAAALHGLGARPDVSAELPGITVPVLAVCGAEDEISPPAEMRAWAQAMPRAEFVELPAAGHLANIENRAGFEGAVARFLEGLKDP
ncbi:MAG: alpha/beta fold hydrolase [Candidatus Brocadiae bacterium]|nr:alpha/beta fold hydrolase [Candidatus Brocadiia bacterium]